MKKYMAFAGRYYYPDGGMEDFIGDFEELDKAVLAIQNKIKDETYYDPWFQIYDTESRSYVEMEIKGARINN